MNTSKPKFVATDATLETATSYIVANTSTLNIRATDDNGNAVIISNGVVKIASKDAVIDRLIDSSKEFFSWLVRLLKTIWSSLRALFERILSLLSGEGWVSKEERDEKAVKASHAAASSKNAATQA